MNTEIGTLIIIVLGLAVFFKFMVRTLAEKKGLRATFMPKPFLNKTGNGCHAHLSIWDKKGKNLFANKNDKLGLSKTAYKEQQKHLIQLRNLHEIT